MPNMEEDTVLITREACDYLRISRPTYAKYLNMGRIRGTRAGKGWKVLRSELDRFLKGANENCHPEEGLAKNLLDEAYLCENMRPDKE